MPMVKFTPSPQQCEDVATLASVGTPLDEIAKSIINPRTGRGVSPKVIRRLFKKQLAEDIEFKKLIVEKFTKEVGAGNWRAIQYGMDHIVGFANGTATASAAPNKGPDAITAGITVKFVSSPAHNEPPVLDVTPRPAQRPKSIEHQALPQPPEQQPPIIDSRDENAVRPLYNQGGTLLRGDSPYKTEMDDPNNPFDDRKRKRPKAKELGRRWRGPLEWSKPKKGGQGWMA
jgi:hypothetical protein